MKELFQQLAPSIMRAFGSVMYAGTLKRVDDTAYNPATGDYVDVYSLSISIDRIALSNYAQRQIDNVSIRPTDRKAIIASADCSVRPTPDHILNVDGADHEIVHVGFDAAEAAYILQIRKP